MKDISNERVLRAVDILYQTQRSESCLKGGLFLLIADTILINVFALGISILEVLLVLLVMVVGFVLMAEGVKLSITKEKLKKKYKKDYPQAIHNP